MFRESSKTNSYIVKSNDEKREAINGFWNIVEKIRLY